MGIQQSEEEQWAKINTDRERSSYYSTGDRTAELNVHLADPVSTETVRREAHSLITENNAQMHKRFCHYHKIWTSDNWKRA
jgi:hypothetical protein